MDEEESEAEDNVVSEEESVDEDTAASEDTDAADSFIARSGDVWQRDSACYERISR